MTGAIPTPPRTARCRRINRDLWAAASAETRREFHRERMKLRRRAQLARVANVGHPRSTSIATGNRRITRIGSPYDCAPHEHKREIARRSRQSASPAPS